MGIVKVSTCLATVSYCNKPQEKRTRNLCWKAVLLLFIPMVYWYAKKLICNLTGHSFENE